MTSRGLAKTKSESHHTILLGYSLACARGSCPSQAQGCRDQSPARGRHRVAPSFRPRSTAGLRRYRSTRLRRGPRRRRRLLPEAEVLLVDGGLGRARAVREEAIVVRAGAAEALLPRRSPGGLAVRVGAQAGGETRAVRAGR